MRILRLPKRMHLLWLQPLADLEISDLSISNDLFHHESSNDNPAELTIIAAKKLRIPVSPICINKPVNEISQDSDQNKGKPVIGGGALFKGRAVEKLTHGLSRRPWYIFNECIHEELKKPERVHIDSYGNVHICQGLSMGNMWKIPLSKLLNDYNTDVHPICAPLIKGGPAALAEEFKIEHEDSYVDECHFCYLLRLSLIDKFPQYLAPRQIYGLE